MRLEWIEDSWFDRRFGRWDLIDDSGSVYLTRWHLWGGSRKEGAKSNGRRKVFLHRMTGPDQDRYPHDHPWPFFSIILRGGYEEDYGWGGNGVYNPMRFVSQRIRWFRTMPATGAWHKITRLLRTPTWTLVFTGKHQREWCFTTPAGLIPHGELEPEGTGASTTA